MVSRVRLLDVWINQSDWVAVSTAFLITGQSSGDFSAGDFSSTDFGVGGIQFITDDSGNFLVASL